ncbi:MAG: hypothetical protein JRF24_06265 [Deltaproteobacteria bacterium]|nr:hypothetical protein [Deltaproteobacteria bacterium]
MKSIASEDTCSTRTAHITGLKSKALQVNLEETDQAVTIDPKYLPLVEVVETLPGLVQQTEGLLCELNHPFKNWTYIIQEMRNYALRNFSVYNEQPKGCQVIEIILNEWLNALRSSSDQSVHTMALDNIVYYVEKIVVDGRTHLKESMPVLSRVFEDLAKLPQEFFFLLSSGYYQVKRIGEAAAQLREDEFDFLRFNPLFRKTLKVSYQYWLSQEDPSKWFASDTKESHQELVHEEIFKEISHASLRRSMEKLNRITQKGSLKDELHELLTLPDYIDIVESYKELPNGIEQLETDTHRMGLIKTLKSLLKIIEIRGLSSIHEDALGRLNRCLAGIIHVKHDKKAETLLRRTFEALKQSMQKFPEAALHALENIGKEIFKSNDSDMVELFIRHTVDLGFQCPDIKGTTTQWKVRVNPAHLTNIKVWLHLIENNPKWSKKLISALITNLKLAGLYIRDTDLFQKEISLFLNSPVAPVYNLAKQLAKLFPVYFNEINAEGELRDVSTELDELSKRQDKLIHFLRKQSHVESNNLLIGFALAIVDYWFTRDKSILTHYVPSEILEQIDDTGIHIDGVHKVIKQLFREVGIDNARHILDFDMVVIKNHLSAVPDKLEFNKQRVLLLVRFLKLLDQKYDLIHFKTNDLLDRAAHKELPKTEYLKKALQSTDLITRLQGILDYLKLLKQIILSPEQFTISEDIYHKRHIAADIPSMYGTYQERKFDALGFSFRLENLTNVLFEKLLVSIKLTFLTRTTFSQIADCMHLLVQAMELDGIVVTPLKRCLNLLNHAIELRRFSFTQYLDIFREFSRAEQQILKTHYTSIYKEHLGPIIHQLGAKRIMGRYFVKTETEISEEIVGKVSETFFRDIVANTFGFQYLDNFISKVIHTLSRESEELSGNNLDLLLSYDPNRTLSGIQNPIPAIEDPITLGSKGYNLIKLVALKMPVPSGFIITTEVFRCFNAIRAFERANEDLRGKILLQIKEIERLSNRHFGNPDNPLLLSVRSGSTVSMPGMMNTFLNVGLNETIVEGLIKRTGNPWFAWDNYRRFLQSWGMSYGMERDVFDAIINDHKIKHGIGQKGEFTPEQMHKVALAYRETLRDARVAMTDDPVEQLFQAIQRVIYSWDSQTATTYRDIMGISNDWGTAVIVQNMVYGNLNDEAGSGVVFTHNPHASVDKVTLWGDYTMGNQGEDVVSGLVRTDSISLEQTAALGREQDCPLEKALPEIFNALRQAAKVLIYENGWSAQEIEFTFEGPTAEKLYLLQSRDMVVSHGKRFPVFIPSAKLKEAFLTRGVGVGGGALSGRIVFSHNDINFFRNKEPDTPIILIRFDTVPDDIREISAADGLLTSRGGATSHASIVANQLGKTCVVGCSKLMVYEKAGYGIISGHTVKCGDFLSIDGQNGFVYQGQHNTTIK